jgi:hypothetical protein
MFKHEMTYEDLDGNEVTDTFYFHLTKLDLATLNAEHKAGYESVLNRIVETKDQEGLINIFRQIIDLSFGIRGEDNKQFIKGGDALKAFQNTFAYSDLFMDLATNDEFAARFINGTFPKDIAENVQKEMDKSALPSYTPPAGAHMAPPVAPRT